MDESRLNLSASPIQKHLEDPYPIDEKLHEKESAHASVYDEGTEESYRPGDPIPEDPDAQPEIHQLTLRAIVIGCLLGTVVQASNIYLGLKTGFTFGPQLLGGIGGFLLLKPIAAITPQWMPKWVGTKSFGPKENCACQTAATAAGGLGILFVSGIPAMYQLNLLGAKPSDDIGKLIAFMCAAAFYGMAFAIPMRSYYILRQRLTFPTPSATAFAIRALHSGKSGAEAARVKGRWLLYSFIACFVQKIGSTWVPGILYDWHWSYWLARWGAPSAIAADNWGWYWEWTPAFFGAGILSGVNASWSFYGGSILAWGIIGPALIATGKASFKDVSDGTGIPYKSYYNMSPADPTSTNTSPRYNLLWVGVLVMLVASFVELGVQWRVIYHGISPLIINLRNKIRARRNKPLLDNGLAEDSIDPMGPADQVPFWAWSSLLVISIIITCLVLGLAFEVNVGLSILAIILGFIFSFIGVMGAGTTDVNPVSTVAKASQLVFGGATHGKYSYAINPVNGQNNHALRVNLFAGLVSAAAAAQTTDMTGDLKTGHLLGARPVVQFVAQGVGAVVSIFITVAFFILFTTASPCIIDAAAETCAYGIPSVAAWKSVALAVTSTQGLPIPKMSGILAIVLSVISALMIIARQTIVPKQYRHWVPNPSAAGLAFVLPQTQYGAAMAASSLFAWYWRKRNVHHYEMVAFSLAAGMIAGEGLGGVAQAVFTVAGIVTGHVQGVGCPQGECA